MFKDLDYLLIYECKKCHKQIAYNVRLDPEKSPYEQIADKRQSLKKICFYCGHDKFTKFKVLEKEKGLKYLDLIKFNKKK